MAPASSCSLNIPEYKICTKKRLPEAIVSVCALKASSFQIALVCDEYWTGIGFQMSTEKICLSRVPVWSCTNIRPHSEAQTFNCRNEKKNTFWFWDFSETYVHSAALKELKLKAVTCHHVIIFHFALLTVFFFLCTQDESLINTMHSMNWINTWTCINNAAGNINIILCFQWIYWSHVCHFAVP